MNVKQTADRMGAKSIEKVRFNHSLKHVCWNGGQVGAMRETTMHTHADGTLYGMCEHCGRFFYATPVRTHGNGSRQFAFA